MRCCGWTLIKWKKWSIYKNYFIFYRRCNENSCKVEVTAERMKVGDEEGLKIPCKLHFTGDTKYGD